ncbi:hypothetical protein CKG00_14550 (plasmid) [Morganella morganii]|uniref:Beta-1,6-galactofuranosyltransferase n=1 Tax=Morganella morganii TaxID=582 RepID=A0A433ZQK8_MORMO|nr:hypothetical protein [Morganella morganii]RUT64413.1 hypothetical protein CKG00_14550 [Morganella morganii]
MTVWFTTADCPAVCYDQNSGLIANRDMSFFSSQAGVSPLSYTFDNTDNVSDVITREKINSLCAPVSAGDTVIVQYPTWMNRDFEALFIAELLAMPGVKVALVLWDVLIWLWDDRDRDFTQDEEFLLMNQCDLIFSPNEKMSARLKEDGGVKTPLISLGLWDYQIEGPVNPDKKYRREVTFIGNLRKTDFSSYDGKTIITLIGDPAGLTETEKAKENLNAIGTSNNNMLLGMLNGGFGLMSYQNKNNVAEKRFFHGAERYGHYNNPLKLSLYLAAGIPVIVDSHSPHAELIKRDNLGLVINDINDIDELLDNLTEQDYNVMVKNVSHYSAKLRDGFFTKNALMKGIRHLTETN